jgi:hypothetical protein
VGKHKVSRATVGTGQLEQIVNEVRACVACVRAACVRVCDCVYAGIASRDVVCEHGREDDVRRCVVVLCRLAALTYARPAPTEAADKKHNSLRKAESSGTADSGTKETRRAKKTKAIAKSDGAE